MSTRKPEPGLPLQMPHRPAWLAGFARYLITRLLKRLSIGHLTIAENEVSWSFGETSADNISAQIIVNKPRFWVDLLLGGTVGGCESYIAEAWDSPDVTLVFRLFLQNRHLFLDLDNSWLSSFVRQGYRLFHRARQNTEEGSRQNISAHYDLGNSFYEQLLDTTMTYSAGIFSHPAATLEQAQVEKYDRLCRKLNLQPGHHLVEIGTGWGGMAEHAAKKYGCRVTTTTISREQHAYASERIARAGLADRVTLLLEDYRNLTGKYDRLVSIEMIEAVGFEFLPTFFAKCAGLLKPDGMMGLQAITIRDQEYTRHVNDVDFIKRYIFPGSCLTSVTSMCAIITAHTDLQLVNLEDITYDYALTLNHWLRNFRKNAQKVSALGFDRRFLRLWELYLQYCEAGFSEHYIGDVQMICSAPDARETGILYQVGR